MEQKIGKEEILGGIGFFLFLWLGFSLFYYCPADYPEDFFPFHSTFHFPSGKLGSLLSRWLYFHLGWLASWIVVLYGLTQMALLFFRTSFFCSPLPLGALLLLFSTVEAEFSGFGGPVSLPPGGVYGIYFAAFFKTYFPFWLRYGIYLTLGGFLFFCLLQSHSSKRPKSDDLEDSSPQTSLSLPLGRDESSEELIYLPLEAGVVALLGGEHTKELETFLLSQLKSKAFFLDSRNFFEAPCVYTNLDELSQAFSSSFPPCLIISDLSDWMASFPEEVEILIKKVSRHSAVLLVTSRPSTDVIPPSLQQSITHRLALAVSSRVESSILLGEEGAESLSAGEALWKEKEKPIRLIETDFQSCSLPRNYLLA